MRFTPILLSLILLPVFVAVQVWDYQQAQQTRLADQVLERLRKHGIRAATVDLRYLDLSVTGDAPDLEVRNRASADASDFPPLRLVADRLTVLSRLAAQQTADVLILKGWLPDEESLDITRSIFNKLRPDLRIDTDDVGVSEFVRWQEGEKLPLSQESLILKPVVASLRAAPALEILRTEDRIVLKGLLPDEALRAGVLTAVADNAEKLPVEDSALRVTGFLTPAPFTDEAALLPFLRSYYASSVPELFSIQGTGNPRLKAAATRGMESEWLRLLRPVSGGARVEAALELHPSRHHFPGQPVLSSLDADMMQVVRDTLSTAWIQFETGSSALSQENQERLAAVASVLLAAGPGLRLVIGGHPDPEGTPAVEAALARERAGRVVSYLTEQGAPCAEMQALAFEPVPIGSPHAPAFPRSVEILVK